MILDFMTIIQITFSVVYLTYISLIVIYMSIKLKELSDIERKVVNNIRLAFTALLIGDLGHVGSRLFILFAEYPTSYYGIFGIGVLLEMIGLIFLFMFYTNAWRIHFNKPNNISFKTLIGIGIFGLIIFAFPQNQWDTEPISYEWLIIRNVPWLIQGVILSGLIIRDARITDDPLMTRIGIVIFISFFFYMPVIFFASLEPRLGMLMIPATILYMLWQYFSYKRFFKNNE
jgi:hypothetical protein